MCTAEGSYYDFVLLVVESNSLYLHRVVVENLNIGNFRMKFAGGAFPGEDLITSTLSNTCIVKHIY